MLSYKYLLLDADGTFLDFSRTEEEALAKLFDCCGIPLTKEYLSAYEAANSEVWRNFEEGKISMERLKSLRFEKFFTSMGLALDPQKTGRMFIKLLSDAAYIIEGAETLLERLSKDYSLSVITNGIAEVQRGRLKKLGLMKYFDGLFISEELGVQKPSAAFFDKTLESLGAQKSQCLVIGDSLTSDMKGAVECGLDALFLNLSGQQVEIDSRIKYQAKSYEELLSIIYA